MSRDYCLACAPDPANRRFCPECKGLGYVERFDRVQGCNKRAPFETPPGPCPLVGEAMTGGWECTHCGDSGPL